MQQMTEMTDTNIKKNPLVLYVSQVRINYYLQRLWQHPLPRHLKCMILKFTRPAITVSHRGKSTYSHLLVIFSMSQFIQRICFYLPICAFTLFSPKLQGRGFFLALPSPSYNANAQTNKEMETPPVTVLTKTSLKADWLIAKML